MKGNINYLLSALLSAGLFSACQIVDDAPVIHPDEYSIVNFQEHEDLMGENQSQGKHIFISLSKVAREDGSITILLNQEGPLERPFTLSSAITSQNTFVVPVQKGIDRVNFKIVPHDDQLSKGHHIISFEIIGAQGPIAVGPSKNYELKLLDDELVGRIKSYETVSDSWKEKRTYHINTIGQLIRETRRIDNPASSISSFEYRYNASNQLIVTYKDFLVPGKRQWINYNYLFDRISKAETVLHDDVISFLTYQYNESGNLSRENYFEKNASGGYDLKNYNTFEYHPDGNIKTSTSYASDGKSGFIVSKTINFGLYLAHPNPTPFYFDVLPNLNMQPHLAQRISIEEGGSTNYYNITYTFDQMGYPLTRTLNGPGGIEVTSYEYF